MSSIKFTLNPPKTSLTKKLYATGSTGSTDATNANNVNIKKTSNANLEIVTPPPETEKKKRRGRPPKKEESKDVKAPKKRGRKPKGGQIVVTNKDETNNTVTTENIIVHLKCTTASLKTKNISNIAVASNNTINNSMNTTLCNTTDIHNTNCNKHITDGNKNPISYFNINNESMKSYFFNSNEKTFEKQISTLDNNNTTMGNSNSVSNDVKNKEHEIIDKLKVLQQQFKYNDVSYNNSNCFWCTCAFENPPIHIPKFIIKDSYHVYGCFCSPECATAYLFNEKIDNSTQFERYSLLCSLYTKVFKYDKNIKPAPNPFYTLDKFCGNLSIMEYRELFNSNRLLFVIDKPVTRQLPELDIMDNNFM